MALASVAVGQKITASIENADRAAINARTIITPTGVGGTGVSINSDGSVNWVNGTSASPCTIDGFFPTTYKSFQVKFQTLGPLNTAVAFTTFLRTTAPATDNTANYTKLEIVGSNAVASSTGPAAIAIGGWAGGSRLLQDWTMEVDNANVALQTVIHRRYFGTPRPVSTSSVYILDALYHDGSTAMGGLQFTAAGNFTGTVRITCWGQD